MTRSFCLVLLLVVSLPAIAAALAVPRYQGYVTDLAAMLSPAAKERLERVLQSFDATDSTQVAVLTIDSLQGDNLEEFSIRVVESWKVGQRGKDNGVLLLIVKQERRIRIEVGRGLEGVLTDLAAGRIVDRVITPLFRQGRFDEGIAAGVDAIIKTTRGEFTQEQGRGQTGRDIEFGAFLNYLPLFGVGTVLLGSVSPVLGVIAGAVVLPLLAFVVFAVPFTLMMLVILVFIGGSAGLILPHLFRGTGGRGGGYYYPGGGWGGSSGSSYGGTSFGGFGGGGFGGGGASGSW